MTLHMVTAMAGWATEVAADDCSAGLRNILRTTDGGHTWKDVTPEDAVGVIGEPAFLGTTRAWVIATPSGPPGSATVMATKDGGRTWQRSTPFAMFREPSGILSFVDSAHGWLAQDLGVAAGSQGLAIYRTSDGGRTWVTAAVTDVNGGRPGELPFGCNKGASFSSATTAWAAGECADFPFFMVSTDAGRTWHDRALPGITKSTEAAVDTPEFFSPADGVVWAQIFLPDSDPFPTQLFYTRDGGRSWHRASLPSAESAFGSPSFLDRGHWWILGDARRPKLYVTADGGRIWRTVVPNVDLTDFSMDFVSTSTGFAVGITSNRALGTTDGGRTWTPFATGLFHEPFPSDPQHVGPGSSRLYHDSGVR